MMVNPRRTYQNEIWLRRRREKSASFSEFVKAAARESGVSRITVYAWAVMFRIPKLGELALSNHALNTYANKTWYRAHKRGVPSVPTKTMRLWACYHDPKVRRIVTSAKYQKRANPRKPRR